MGQLKAFTIYFDITSNDRFLYEMQHWVKIGYADYN